MSIAYGTVLRARPCHPIHRRGGDSVAFVTHVDDAGGFTFLWVNGDPATPGFSGDTDLLNQIDDWFEIVPAEDAGRILPEGFAPPLDPRRNPAASFAALFGRC